MKYIIDVPEGFDYIIAYYSDNDGFPGAFTTVRAYDAEPYTEPEPDREQIHAGDEVIIKSDGIKGVVLDEDLCGEFSVFTENGCCEAYRKIHFEKTGRHFPEVEKLLEEMRS